MPTVSPAYLQSTISFLASLGVSTDYIALQSHMHSQKSNSTRVPMDVYVALLNHGVAATNNTLFGFELGKHIQAKDYGVLGYLVESCENLAQAIDALTRFDALVADIGTTSVIFDEDNTQINWSPKSQDCKQMVLRNTTAWVATVYKILGSACQLTAVTFTFSLDNWEKSTLENWFNCDVKSSASANSIVFPTHLLHVPFTSENKAMFSALIKVTETELLKRNEKSRAHAVTDEDVKHKVVALLKAKPTLKGCDQQRVADALFISPRTLQRKLKQSGTSYQQILSNERKARLNDLLLHHTIADTADLLGFQEQSSFTHAFKSWFSTTPLKYQQELKGQ